MLFFFARIYDEIMDKIGLYCEPNAPSLGYILVCDNEDLNLAAGNHYAIMIYLLGLPVIMLFHRWSCLLFARSIVLLLPCLLCSARAISPCYFAWSEQ